MNVYIMYHAHNAQCDMIHAHVCTYYYTQLVLLDILR